MKNKQTEVLCENKMLLNGRYFTVSSTGTNQLAKDKISDHSYAGNLPC